MDEKKQMKFGRVLALICICASLTQAGSTTVNVTSMGIKPEVAKLASTSTPYQGMSTEALEYEVERLTLSGDVPFEMGVELMKRWTRG